MSDLTSTELYQIMKAFSKLAEQDETFKILLEDLEREEVATGIRSTLLLEQIFSYLEDTFQEEVNLMQKERLNAS